jgi:NAD(P)-dependent dehydrogenase (short-subunit alcohol dehydrogenase family)
VIAETRHAGDAARLAGKVALVTGAGRGIGRAIALRLARDGARIVLVDRNKEHGEETLRLLSEAGAKARFAEIDITDRAAVRGAISDAIGEFGAIDILVNNAGIGKPAAFLDIVDSDWNAMMSVNLHGVFVVSQEVARTMVERQNGRIVNMASLAAHTANDHQAAYAASKAAVVALTKVMAFELGRQGITVNAISPGPIDTELAAVMLTPEARRAREDRIPLGKLGQPEDVAAAVAFLASADAAYINGTVLVVDGGLLIAGIRASG